MRKVFAYVKNESQRLPSKNFLNLGNKPLWQWLINRLDKFDVYVNTDSQLLFDELSSYPYVTPIWRNQVHIDWENNADKLGSPASDMVREFVENHLTDNQNFALVHVTSPFLLPETLERAFEEFERQECHSLHSVVEIKDCLMFETDEGVKPLNFAFDKISRTQDLESVYQSNGAFFIMNSGKLKQSGYRRLAANSRLFPIDPIEAIEIDTPADFEKASLIARFFEGD